MDPRSVRRAAGLSQLQVAARARCSIPTVRAYELNLDFAPVGA